MNDFRALRIHDVNGQMHARLQTMTLNELTPGEVVIEVHYSSVNYKDALAATGSGKILRRHPLNGGIDAAGVVLESKDERFEKGDEVLITGCGIGENFDGGYSEVLRASADSVVKLPQGLSLREAMILGTAGFTAALAFDRMEDNGQKPQLGPILVTGASGGVGSFAVQIFSQQGYEVHAVSGKPDAAEYLKLLGAQQVIHPDELKLGSRPLETVRYGGAVDNVGGALLSKLLAHIQLWGNIASIGLAESAEIHASVMPFILRGVSLLGVSSNNTPMDTRRYIWQQLGSSWKPQHLDEVLSLVVSLDELPTAFQGLLNRKIRGRVLVAIKGER